MVKKVIASYNLGPHDNLSSLLNVEDDDGDGGWLTVKIKYRRNYNACVELPPQRWAAFYLLVPEINTALQTDIRAEGSYPFQTHIGGSYFVSVEPGSNVVDIGLWREMQENYSTAPSLKACTRSSVLLILDEWKQLCRLIPIINNTFAQLHNAQPCYFSENHLDPQVAIQCKECWPYDKSTPPPTTTPLITTPLPELSDILGDMLVDNGEDTCFRGGICTTCGVISPGSKLCVGCYHRKHCQYCPKTPPPTTSFGRLKKCRVSFLPTPRFITGKHCVINVQNRSDNKCFQWSVLAALYPVTKDASRRSKYTHVEDVMDTKSLKFPVQVKDVHEFEMRNPTISINVLSMNDKVPYMEYRSPYLERTNHVNLLLLRDDNNKGHYVWIKNLPRLLGYDIYQYVCNGCLHCFKSQNGLQYHKEICYKLAAGMVLPSAQHCLTLSECI